MATRGSYVHNYGKVFGGNVLKILMVSDKTIHKSDRTQLYIFENGDWTFILSYIVIVFVHVLVYMYVITACGIKLLCPFLGFFVYFFCVYLLT